MDAITMLKDDHKTVEQLFKRFEKAGDRAYKEKRQLVDRIIEELAVHAAIEEQLFYPVTRETVPAVEDEALESLEEHHLVKILLAELERMDPEHERFDAKVTVLMENVRHHVEEEESDYFPKVRDELGRNALGELGDAMAEARKVAPTRPHPGAPDEPPGNLVAGTAAGAADRIADALSGLAQGGVSVAQDLIARLRGTPKRSSSPRGGSTARRTARTVRSAADEAVDAVVDATRKARDTGKATVDAAGRGAQETARAAERGASRTTGTAKKAARTTAKRASATAKKTPAKKSPARKASARKAPAKKAASRS